MNIQKNQYSAGEQGIGYIYQGRLALLKLLQWPEDTSVLIEKDDDLDFVVKDGVKILASLKHKSTGDRLSNLSVDFWKSVNIWVERYQAAEKQQSSLRFFLFTTGKVSDNSFLSCFLESDKDITDDLLKKIMRSLSDSKSKTINPIRAKIEGLNQIEKKDFFSRINIFDNSPRITDVPEIIVGSYMRAVRPEYRKPVYERLEGWWSDLVIKLLTGIRSIEIFGHEVSDKLSQIADEYKIDNLPIHFRGEKPVEKVDPENDPRLFVAQLREIGITPNRIQNAIFDYYRAFKQRSAWARENVLLEGEVEEYEERLVDEWGRYRDVLFEDLGADAAENALTKAGKELYKWAEFNTSHLRIRDRVSEPYVVRGNFHILANEKPAPRVYWHPRFLNRLDSILKGLSSHETLE